MDDRQIREKIGALLKAERERQQTNLADLAQQLKISEENLACIERGDTASLPSDLYFTLFAKSYASSIGIDYTRTVEAIKAEVQEQAAPPKKAGKGSARTGDGEESEEEESSSFAKIGWIAGSIVGAFAIFLILNTFVFKSETADSDGSTEADAGQLIDNSAFASYQWPGPKESEAPAPLSLSLSVRGDVWTTIFADGDTALRQTLYADRTYTVEAEHRLQLWIAAPSRVQLALNGSPIDARDGSNRVSGVEINQLNKDDFISGRRTGAGSEPAVTTPPPPSPAPQTEPQSEGTGNDSPGQTNNGTGE